MQKQMKTMHGFLYTYSCAMMHCVPIEDILPQRMHTGSLLSRVVFYTFLELNKLCPRANSLYAFCEATYLQWRYSVLFFPIRKMLNKKIKIKITNAVIDLFSCMRTSPRPLRVGSTWLQV